MNFSKNLKKIYKLSVKNYQLKAILPIFRNLKPTTYHLKPSRGFTIVELIVVIAIIGIVTSIIMASISNAKAKGRDSKRIADISVIQLALENYYDQYHHYPVTSDYPTVLNDSNLINRGPIPQDPSTNLDYSYSALIGDNTATCSNNCQSYHLGATLELNNGILSDDEDLPLVSGDFNGSDSSLVYDVVPKF